MKIGILTLQLLNNYGGNLQAFALMKYLKDNGHEPYLIKIKLLGPNVNWYINDFVKRLTINIPCCFKALIDKYKIADYRTVSQYSTYFIDKYINPQTSFIIKRPKQFAKLEKYNFDAYIVGSDQVWRKDYVYDFLEQYFLCFPKNKNIKKISYAASFGFDNWDYDKEETEKIKNLVKDFDLLTLREDRGIEFCAKYLNASFAEHVIDPTMLLNKQDYIELIEKEDATLSEGDCMVYVLDMDTEKRDMINQIAKIKGLKTFTVNEKPADEVFSRQDRVFPPVTNWLRGFMDAKYVITDSFHGTIFSVLFNKPFIVIGNHKRGFSRFTSLGRLLGIQSRILSSAHEFRVEMLDEEMDWENINNIVENERKKAKLLLNGVLNRRKCPASN